MDSFSQYLLLSIIWVPMIMQLNLISAVFSLIIVCGFGKFFENFNLKIVFN